MLLDRRRSQERGRAMGVPDSEPVSSPSRVPGASIVPKLKLARGVMCARFCPIRVVLSSRGRAFPFSLTERGDGVSNPKACVMSNCCGAYPATAVISFAVRLRARVWGGWRRRSCSEGLASRTTARPAEAIPMPAPEAHNWQCVSLHNC